MAASLIGQKLGEYEVIARVGTGGMGAVFEARHPVIGKRVAVKVLHPVFANNPTIIERFVNEARVVNAIGHPAIVDIFSFGQTSDGLHYYVMEFLKGRSFAQLIDSGGAVPMGDALELVAQLLEVLDAAHRAGVVHRDLKPENLFVEEANGVQRVRVLDFGIAKLVGPELRSALTGSAVLGTPGYMSPEQINSEPITPSADLFSTGAVLFELLTGEQVFAASNVGDLLLKALHEPARRASSVKPDLPSDVDALVDRLLQRDPKLRPATARDALDRVRWLQHQLERHGTLPTLAEVPQVGARPQRVVAGVDDRATAARPSLKAPPAAPLPEAMRTEPSWVPSVVIPPRSRPAEPPAAAGANAAQKPARAPRPMHEVGPDTTVDRQATPQKTTQTRYRSVIAVILVGLLVALAIWRSS